ncbi:MAG: 30S ribosomal protein S7 [Pigeon pea little leaf phytoplasma]|uniref:Small ribosomal subunit protein uS7 n=1 Tax=Candidatus Phytoplasma fabacearum TaxID=2982628 RepID=A0ABU8ZS77_9MOLU|nr:30S ribosomal protein S7 ['Bituminaria bituminosa' little leaf phytoplasma]MDV3148673.1 30S ribosomal protein S7 [Pigeon pea little leaf phytoplasma]MDO7983516.1 30S ribosomal protein S7 ['Bituminaria bituminosa' little leaf phytoplasma]MDO8023808.1 30S ribosomal protein S7 ['Bituminaria bituminosa' little leaf phytoplasma]MDO8030636.1 30S ribosomal protein S7 ['Bituminaria bituminosa' little leaf phytoplasma]MDV3154097.1 30S ribosomal protein S7 [Pigeon pea little leaf phytoplasma]
MSRKKSFKKRTLPLDPVYNSVLVTRVINKLMKDGKKDIACSIVYNCLSQVKILTKKEPIEVLNEAFNHIMPLVELRTRTIGSQKYQVPLEVSVERRYSLGLKWLIMGARKRNEKSMKEKLAQEIISAASGTGLAVKKRDEIHRMSEANRSFAHYRW